MYRVHVLRDKEGKFIEKNEVNLTDKDNNEDTLYHISPEEVQILDLYNDMKKHKVGKSFYAMEIVRILVKEIEN